MTIPSSLLGYNSSPTDLIWPASGQSQFLTNNFTERLEKQFEQLIANTTFQEWMVFVDLHIKHHEARHTSSPECAHSPACMSREPRRRSLHRQATAARSFRPVYGGPGRPLVGPAMSLLQTVQVASWGLTGGAGEQTRGSPVWCWRFTTPEHGCCPKPASYQVRGSDTRSSSYWMYRFGK